MYHYKEGDIIKFGKHKGKVIDDVVEDDPKYIEWCLDNIDGFTINNELFDRMENILYPDYLTDNSWHDAYDIISGDT